MEQDAAPPMQFRTLLLWSLLLTPVFQWLFLVALSLFSYPDRIGCTNWHGEMLTCSVFEALLGNVTHVFYLNVLTLGTALVVALGFSMLVVFLFKVCVPVTVARSRWTWIGVTCAFGLVVIVRAVQTSDIRTESGNATAAPPGQIIILRGSGGGATLVDPAVSSPVWSDASPGGKLHDDGGSENDTPPD